MNIKIISEVEPCALKTRLGGDLPPASSSREKTSVPQASAQRRENLSLADLLAALPVSVRERIDGITNGTPDTKNVRKAKRQTCLRILNGADPDEEVAALRVRVDELLAVVRGQPAAHQARTTHPPKRPRLSEVRAAYEGSNGGDTRRLLDRFRNAGPIGVIAAALFKAKKSNERARTYRGGINRSAGHFDSFSDLSYDSKRESIRDLCEQLMVEPCGMTWGWKEGHGTFLRFVFYIDLPQGQVCFQVDDRFEGPDYSGQWDGKWLNQCRILDFCEEVFKFAADEHESGR
jgi:hypothetical protein